MQSTHCSLFISKDGLLMFGPNLNYKHMNEKEDSDPNVK